MNNEIIVTQHSPSSTSECSLKTNSRVLKENEFNRNIRMTSAVDNQKFLCPLYRKIGILLYLTDRID